MQPCKGSRQVQEYLPVSRVANVLGVSPSTLRNWDRGDKLKAGEHPTNGYRHYRRADLERMLRQIEPRREPEGPLYGSR